MKVRLTLLITLTLALIGCRTVPAPPKPAKLADGRSQWATLGTNRIHYVTVGDGPQTIVLVHCWSGNLGFWREQVPALSDKARLVLVDLPGHGRSDAPQTNYSMDYFASGVLAVLEHAQVERAVFIGHSMGGPVIARVCDRAPEKIAGVVALDCLLLKPRMSAEEARQFTAQFASAGYRSNATVFIRSMFPVRGTEALRDRVVSEMLQTPQHVMHGAMEGIFSPDQPDWTMKPIQAPLIVLNAKSQHWPPGYELFARSLSPRMEYRMLSNAGHWFMMERPSDINALLLDSLKAYGLIAK